MTILVVDASVVIDLICGFPAATPFVDVLASADTIAAPAHLDAEVLSAFGRLHRTGHLTHVAERVDALATLGAQRWPLPPLLAPAWALTSRVAVRDALYVVLAQSLGAVLVSTDVRLRRGAADLVTVAEPERRS